MNFAAIQLDGAKLQLVAAHAIEKLDMPNYQGKTPLCIAAYNGNADAVSALLRAGAGVNTTDRMGYTALRLALRFHHPDVATVLRAAGGR